MSLSIITHQYSLPVVHNLLSINMETPQSTATLREVTPLEAVSFLESELSTVSPSTEEQSTRSTSPQLLSSSII